MGDERHFLGLPIAENYRTLGRNKTVFFNLRCWTRKTQFWRFVFAFSLAVFFWSPVVCANDGCDWKGSGLDDLNGDPNSQASSRSVRPLYLRCSQGRIEWLYPRGALRLLLNLNRHSGGTFQLSPTKSTPNTARSTTNTVGLLEKILRVFRSPEKVKIDENDDPHEEVPIRSGPREFRGCIRVEPSFQGARIYLEGHRKLHLLHGGRADPRPLEMVRCFVSVKGQAALYVEAELPGPPGRNPEASEALKWKRRVAAFSYDLEPLGMETYADSFKECRPCSDEELLQNYCTSDFVVLGRVTSFRENVSFDRTELTIMATKLLRDTELPIFINASNKFYNSNKVLNTLESEKQVTPRYGVVQRPLKCGTKVAKGEFLFMGHLVLGNPKITCAPRIGDWKKIRRKALLEATNQCNLD